MQEPKTAVLEHSTVGESQSNGIPERQVQKFEDLLRTHQAAVEDSLKHRTPSKGPLMLWLIEHVAAVLNRYSFDDEGKTPYEHMHGRKQDCRIR